MKAVDAIAYNAATTLDGKHGDKLPTHQVIDKFLDDLSKVKELVGDLFNKANRQTDGLKSGS